MPYRGVPVRVDVGPRSRGPSPRAEIRRGGAPADGRTGHKKRDAS